jgi:2-aminobenzoate-CoA ligase
MPPRLMSRSLIYCVVHFLDRWVEQGHGDDPCIFSPGVGYSYSEIQSRRAVVGASYECRP